MEPQADFAGVSLLKFTFAAATVLGLMGLLAWVLKYLAARGWIAPASGAGRRIKVVESLNLDARRRLVIINCDGKEHLLLLGAQDIVICETSSSPKQVKNKSS